MLSEIIENSFSDISTTSAKDLIASQSLSQSPQIPKADDPILTTELSSRLHDVSNIWNFEKSYRLGFTKYNENTIINPQDVIGVSSQRITYTTIARINLIDS